MGTTCWAQALQSPRRLGKRLSQVREHLAIRSEQDLEYWAPPIARTRRGCAQLPRFTEHRHDQRPGARSASRSDTGSSR